VAYKNLAGTKRTRHFQWAFAEDDPHKIAGATRLAGPGLTDLLIAAITENGKVPLQGWKEA
jgi:hypothetical protein